MWTSLSQATSFGCNVLLELRSVGFTSYWHGQINYLLGKTAIQRRQFIGTGLVFKSLHSSLSQRSKEPVFAFSHLSQGEAETFHTGSLAARYSTTLSAFHFYRMLLCATHDAPAFDVSLACAGAACEIPSYQPITLGLFLHIWLFRGPGVEVRVEVCSSIASTVTNVRSKR